METYLKELDEAFKSIVSKLKEELKTMRSNRASVDLVEDLPVEAYGQTMSVKQLGSLSLGPQREIFITVWDKGVMGAVIGAIQNAKLGLSVSAQGEMIIRATLPSLSSERREELSKMVKKTVEEFRVQVRSRRDEVNKKLKAAEDKGELTEDDMATAKKLIQEATDKGNAEIEKILESKLKEIQE